MDGKSGTTTKAFPTADVLGTITGRLFASGLTMGSLGRSPGLATQSSRNGRRRKVSPTSMGSLGCASRYRLRRET